MDLELKVNIVLIFFPGPPPDRPFNLETETNAFQTLMCLRIVWLSCLYIDF